MSLVFLESNPKTYIFCCGIDLLRNCQYKHKNVIMQYAFNVIVDIQAYIASLATFRDSII